MRKFASKKELPPPVQDKLDDDQQGAYMDSFNAEFEEGTPEEEAQQSRDRKGAVTLFDAVEVLAEMVAVNTPATPEGWVWETEMLKPGLSLNGTMYYTPEFIREAARDFEGAPSYADHQATPSGSIRNVVGTFRNVKSEPRPKGSGPLTMTGELHLLKSENWIREKLLAAQEARMPMGLSINAIVGLKKSVRRIGGEAREVLEPQKLIPNTPRSVDVVMFPAAGGRVVRAVAGHDMETALCNARKEFVKASPAGRGHSGSAKWSNQGEKMEHTYAEKSPSSGGAGAEIQEELRPIAAEVERLKMQVDVAQQRQRVAEAVLLINRKVNGSKLPTPLARLVREHFEGTTPAPEDLDEEIARVREAYAAVVASPTHATGRVAIIQEPEDRLQIALDLLFGVRKGTDGKPYDHSVPAFRGIQEAYIAITGDRDLRWEQPAGRITEDWNSAGFANALGNTIYRRLIQDYAEVDYGMDLLSPPREPHRVALKDFRTHDIIRVGYLTDLTTVDPEQIDWPEIAPPTDEQATIAAVQFGGLVSVTRKTIINDDLGLVAKVASRIGRAARRTMAQRLYNLMINNANIYDGVTFFHANHNNLGSTALAASELNNIRTAMRNQTEKDSGKRLGISPYLLVVPNELEGAARTTNQRVWLDNQFTPNPVYNMFGATSERIIVSPLLTETDDYYVFANPDEVQTFEIGFLQGKAEPELLLADNQLVGKAFTSDRIQYKVRHEYEVTVVDFRGAYKELV